MNPKKINEAATRLESWTKTLLNHINSGYPQVREVLNGKSDLPHGCPSKESLAELCLREFKSDIVEITAAFKDMSEAVWERKA
jgi:hypothetical protein